MILRARFIVLSGVFALCGLAAAVQSPAADVGYHLTAGVAESDNIARASEDKRSEAIASAGLDFSIVQTTRRLDVDTSADLAWLHYLENTYDDRASGNLQGLVRADLISQRLVWVLQENFGQARIDPLSPVRPDNLEYINFVTTGPDLSLPLGDSNRLRLAGRYSKVSYETSPGDNQRYSGTVGLVHLLSARSSVSLNAQRERIEFDETTAVGDYDRDQAYLNYQVTGRRTRINFDAGISRLDRPGDSSHGTVLRFQLGRELSSASTLTLTGGREYSDASADFRFSQSLSSNSIESQPALQTSEPFTSRFLQAGWNFSRQRTTLELDVGRYEDSYVEDKTFDRKRFGANGFLMRDLTSALRARLSGYYMKENFASLPVDSRESGAAFDLSRRFGRAITVEVQYQYLKRTSERADTDFVENRVWLKLSYGREAPPRRMGFADERRISE